MNKRTRFVLVSIILSLGLWLSQIVGVEERLGVILALTATAYILSAWVLFEDLKGSEWITLMILPVSLTLGAGLFSYYLPFAIPSLAGMKFSIETSIFIASITRIIFFGLFGKVFGLFRLFFDNLNKRSKQ